MSGDNCSVAGCFEPLQPHVEESGAPAHPCGAPGCGMPLPCPLHPAGPADAGHREVAAHLAASAAATPQRATESHGVATAELRFPWGVVNVPADGLTVGRDFGDECGEQIDTFDNVSRAHARVAVEEGQVFVVDLDSTNGTTVNGARLRAAQPQAVCDGDVLGFGNRLRATVATGRALP
jgi:hypothetical protein